VKKRKEHYSRVRDLQYKGGIKCKGKGTPSQTAGIAKALHCQKRDIARLAMLSRFNKQASVDQIVQQWRYWNTLNKTTSLIY
jgi:hypothetical protein